MHILFREMILRFSRNIMLCNGNGNAEVSCVTRVGKSLPQRQSQRESKRESERERELSVWLYLVASSLNALVS